MTAGATLGETLAAGRVLHLKARVGHARAGAIRHAFTYWVDYLLLAPETARGRGLFSRNRINLLAVHDRDHGGPRGRGEGAAWARRVLSDAGLPLGVDVTVALMTQPRFLGYWFTPVSFWLALRGDDVIAAIAEVNNTFGQRHSYLCRLPDFAPIGPGDSIAAAKVFHVSPFMDVAGSYTFRFAIAADRVDIRIIQKDGDRGLVATMAGRLGTLGWRQTLGAALRRPGGPLRVLALIYWNALRLKLKGAAYRRPPALPEDEVS